ncbi:MAG: insulinase family protein [Holosporales bacterium]|jgi:zinc protease|nr:insulinase family protein [Holosporales bacterium]
MRLLGKLFWRSIRHLAAICVCAYFSTYGAEAPASLDGTTGAESEAKAQDDGKDSGSTDGKANSKKLGIQTATLANGMKVIVLPTSTKGVVSMCVGYFVGSADDPRNVVGISHLLEHMMFKGTTTISGEDLKELLFTYNKDSGAFTGFDITVFEATCSRDLMERNLKIEADRMVNLKLTKDDIDREKNVVIEERKLTTESNPITNYMQEAAWRAMYLHSTYSYPLVGYLDQINACDEAALRAHYDRYYVPNNAFVLVVGDITLDEAVEKAQKCFGSIPAGDDPRRSRVIDPEDTGLRFNIDRESPQISVHNLNIIYTIKRKLISDFRKLMVVDMMVDILACGESSVLYQQIVDKEELAFTLSAYLDVRAFDKARVNIASVARDAKKVDVIDKRISEIIAEFPKTLTREKVEREKQKYLDQISMVLDNSHSAMMFVLEYLINGYDVGDLDKARDVISSITFEEVVEAAKAVFNPKNRSMRILSHPARG